MSNKGSGLGYSGRGIATNMGTAKESKAIASLRVALPPEIELIEHEFIPSRYSGHCSLIWHNAAYGALVLTQYVKAAEISKVLEDLPKWKYIAQSVAIAYGEWKQFQILPIGSTICWKFSYSNTFQYRDTKKSSLWKREERIGSDWLYKSVLELEDFRGATSPDLKYYSPSGEEITRSHWNHSDAWALATNRWKLHTEG